jgi:hypothetical protein
MVTLAGFISFIQLNMQIPASALPTNSPVIPMALAIAQDIVNPALCAIGNVSTSYAGPSIYDLAVYNLAGDNLINFATDQSVAIAGIAWASSTATATTAVAHGFNTGDPILITGNAPLAYNSQPGPNNASVAAQIVVTSSTAFSYPVAANPGSFVSGGQASEIFFANARRQFGINSFVAGVISSSADVSTSESLLVPDQMKTLTLSNLQNLKTPWGRQYLAFAMQYGSLWGMS